MKVTCPVRPLFVLAMTFVFLPSLALGADAVQKAPQGAKAGVASASYKPLSASELDAIATPIALYPDVLLLQMLPASTFPDQLVDAALFLESGQDTKLIAEQPWDPSVKAIANYPSILMSMVGNPVVTQQIADAFLNQHSDLLRAVQRLRSRAQAAGKLTSTQEQAVVEEKSPGGTTIIQIQPTNPEVVYVPTTTYATTSYSQPAPSTSLAPVATLGLGMMLGYAMNDDDDDDHHHYYYGGRRGGAIWYNNDAYDDWIDHRRDRWDDISNARKDQINFRQDMKEDRQNFRQDSWNNMSPEQRSQWANKKKTQWDSQGRTAAARSSQAAAKRDELKKMSTSDRQQWAQNKRSKVQSMSPEQRRQVGQKVGQDWKSRAGKHQSQWSSMSSSQKQAFAQQNRAKVQSRAAAKKSGSGYTRPTSSSRPSPSKSSSSTAFSSMSSRSQVTRASQRGSMSRASMAGSRGGRRGGGRRR